jgi:hypothetical protein
MDRSVRAVHRAAQPRGGSLFGGMEYSLQSDREEETPAFFLPNQPSSSSLSPLPVSPHSTVTLLAKFRGWSTLVPRSTAMW